MEHQPHTASSGLGECSADDRQFQVGDKVRVNLHHGKIDEAVVRAVIQHENEIKLQVDVVGLDLTALIDTRQDVE